MEFIIENYLWILISIIVVLMGIVGYIADRTGFIKKSEKPKQPKQSKQVKEKNTNQMEQPIIIEDKGIDELLKNSEKNTSQMEKEENINSDISTPLEENANIEEVDQSLFAPLESNETELKSVDVTPLEEIDNAPSTEEDIWKF